MVNRKRVIKGLKHCSEDGCKDCPYETDCIMADGFSELAKDALELLKEQDDGKYEYHYDHTDCIWYRQGQSVDCPSTCSQYRDGWNDAMQYIFHNGKGYSPYKREEGEVR